MNQLFLSSPGPIARKIAQKRRIRALKARHRKVEMLGDSQGSWKCLWTYSTRPEFWKDFLESRLTWDQIASHIHPLDMLQLSRVSPYFRELLTTKDARFYWRAARENIELPDCPPDLSEMQYVSLVFERNCFVGLFLLSCRLAENCYRLAEFRDRWRSATVSKFGFVVLVGKSSKYLFCPADLNSLWMSSVQTGKKLMRPHKYVPDFFSLLVSNSDGAFTPFNVLTKQLTYCF